MNKHHTPDNRRHCRRNYDIRLMLLFFLLAGVPFAAQAHRGAVDEIDACNIRVGLERVHFTAYTPALSEWSDINNTLIDFFASSGRQQR